MLQRSSLTKTFLSRAWRKFLGSRERRPTTAERGPRHHLLALEPRLLFDASVLATAIDLVGHNPVPPLHALDSAGVHSDHDPTPSADHTGHDGHDASAPAVTGQAKAITQLLAPPGGFAMAAAAPPVVTSNAAIAYTENGPALPLDSAITISDPDSANLAGVTVAITSGFETGKDRLVFTNGLGITGAWDGNTGVLTLTGVTTPGNYQLALRTVKYINDSDSPAAGLRTISWVASDGALSSVPATSSAVVATANDPPTATNLNVTDRFAEDSPAYDLTDIVITDDDPTTTATLTISIPAAGTLNTATAGAVTSTYNAATGLWSASGALADVNTLLAGLHFTLAPNVDQDFSMAVVIKDPSGLSVTGTRVFDILPVDDPTVVTNLSTPEAMSEDAPILALADIVITDPDTPTFITTLTLSDPTAGSFTTASAGAVTSTFNAGTGVWRAGGAIADVNTLLAGVAFLPAHDYERNFTIATAITDGIQTQTEIKIVSVTPANDAPVVTNASTPEHFIEDAAAFLLTPVTVGDVDIGAVATATLTLSNPAAGTLSTGNSHGVTSTFDPATGLWTASGATADVNTLMGSILFTPAADFDQSFTIAVSVSDGFAPAVTGVKTVTVTPVNDPPQATNMSAAEVMTEDAPALPLTDVIVSDVDGPITSAVLTLSDPAAGVLSTATSGAVTSVFNPFTGTWTAVGATADVNDLLASVQFVTAADYDRNFTIATQVSDGLAPIVTGTKVVTVIAVNDTPVVTGGSTAETVVEDSAGITLAPITVTDPDTGAVITATLTLTNPAAGRLTTASFGGAQSTYTPAVGLWTATGTPAQVSGLLAAIQLIPAADYDRNFAIAVAVTDGVSASLNSVKAVAVTAVNDAPLATNLSSGEGFVEDSPAFNLTPIVITDVDTGATATATLTLSDPAAGVFATATAGGTLAHFDSISGQWSASGPLAEVNQLLAGLRFTPSADYDRNFTIATTVSDGVAPPLTGVKNIAVTAVNDAPSATAMNAPETVIEDAANLDLTDIVVADPDTGAVITARLTLSDRAAGVLTTATAGGAIAGYDGQTGVWLASGTVAEINSLLAAVQFLPAADYDRNCSIATMITDGVAPGLTGLKAVTVTAVNDAPTATNLSAAEIITEDGPATLLSTILVADPDTGAMITARLSFSDPAAGALTTSSAGGASSTFDGLAGIWQASGTVAEINSLLAAVQFLPAADYDRDFTIATMITDGEAPALVGRKNVTVTPVNDAPIVTGIITGIALFEDDGPTTLGPVVITDPDSGDLVTATLTLSAPWAGQLSTPAVTNAAATYDRAAGRWQATGSAVDVTTLLAAVTFTPTVDYNQDFAVDFTVSDSAGATVTGTKPVTVTAVNDAPSFTAGPMTLTTIMMNNQNSAGDRIDALLPAGAISDVDGTPATAVAITRVDNRDGVWQFSADGSTWLPVAAGHGAVLDIDQQARLLDSDYSLRFLPDPGFYGDAFIEVRAWDKSAGTAGGTASTAGTGGVSPFSDHSATGFLKVNIRPLPGYDRAETGQDATIAISVLENDWDGNADRLTVTAVTAPGHGAVRIVDGTTVVYTPRFNYSGPDRFIYTIADGYGGEASALVLVDVRENLGSPTNITNVEVAGLPAAAVEASLASVTHEPFRGGLAGSETAVPLAAVAPVHLTSDDLALRNDGEMIRAFVWNQRDWLSTTFSAGHSGELIRQEAILSRDDEAVRTDIENAATALESWNPMAEGREIAVPMPPAGSEDTSPAPDEEQDEKVDPGQVPDSLPQVDHEPDAGENDSQPTSEMPIGGLGEALRQEAMAFDRERLQFLRELGVIIARR